MKITYFISFISVLFCCAACEKTIDPPALSDSRMLGYKIVNVVDNPIYGSISEEEKTITVYLPYYLQLRTIQPEITVSEGASVTPASGTMIENLIDLFQKPSSEITYTVTGSTGSSSVYELKIITQQPDFQLNEISADPDHPAEYVIKADAYVYIIWSGASLLDKEVNKVALVDENGNEFVFDNVDRNGVSYTADVIRASFPLNVKDQLTPGLYYVKVTNYSRSVTMKNPIRLKSE